jgi:hypothetical protein
MFYKFVILTPTGDRLAPYAAVPGKYLRTIIADVCKYPDEYFPGFSDTEKHIGLWVKGWHFVDSLTYYHSTISSFLKAEALFPKGSILEVWEVEPSGEMKTSSGHMPVYCSQIVKFIRVLSHREVDNLLKAEKKEDLEVA